MSTLVRRVALIKACIPNKIKNKNKFKKEMISSRIIICSTRTPMSKERCRRSSPKEHRRLPKGRRIMAKGIRCCMSRRKKRLRLVIGELKRYSLLAESSQVENLRDMKLREKIGIRLNLSDKH